MWSIFQTVAELVDVQGPLVVLRTARRLTPGKTQRVKLITARGNRSVKVQIRETRSLEGQGFASTAVLVEDVRIGTEDCRPTRATGVRRASRHECRLRVLSPDLPGYRGVSVDFSSGGMQLEACGELRLGQEIQLRVEFDDTHGQALECQARVAWKSRRGRTCVAHGVQFINLTPHEAELVATLERTIETRNDLPIAMRVLA